MPERGEQAAFIVFLVQRRKLGSFRRRRQDIPQAENEIQARARVSRVIGVEIEQSPPPSIPFPLVRGHAHVTSTRRRRGVEEMPINWTNSKLCVGIKRSKKLADILLYTAPCQSCFLPSFSLFARAPHFIPPVPSSFSVDFSR